MNSNQSFLLTETYNGETRTLLIDCGYSTPYALSNANIPVIAIDEVYISHLHADHTGGLEFLALNRYDWASKFRPTSAKDFSKGFKAPHLYCEKNLMENLWNHSLRGGLETIEGTMATLGTFFHLHPISTKDGFKWQGWDVDIIQQVHIFSGTAISLAFGVMFRKQGASTIYFTTDSQHCSPRQTEVFYEEADVIFQDCEIDCLLSNVHANYIQLAGYEEANAVRLKSETKAKMKLSHYQDFYATKQKRVVKNSPYPFYRAPESQSSYMGMIDFDWDKQAEIDGFDGFVRVGDVYDTDKPGGMYPYKILGEAPRYAEDQAVWAEENKDKIENIRKRDQRLTDLVELAAKSRALQK